jgi:superfamily II DNA or RNA helicase
MSGYTDFLDSKTGLEVGNGFEPYWIPDFLYGFQKDVVKWALRQGRGAIFADCGLGKTPMQLVWAENVRRETDKPVLILTPLAVAAQTEWEAEKFCVEAGRSTDGSVAGGITIANYHRLHYFDPDDFGGVVLDESSILKSFDGAYKTQITEFMKRVEFRLLATATAAPNDYVELGTSSEALGYLGHVDMLGRFFRNAQNNVAQRRMHGKAMMWRFKGHAEGQFWRWVCSWARALRKPSDLGYDDDKFNLPPLTETEHLIEANTTRDGMLFDLPASGLWEEREEMRRTIAERCEFAANVANSTTDPVVVWCHYNDEGDALTRAIPDSEQVKGSDSPEKKESRLAAFGSGDLRVLVTKPKIGAWGLNWQHCNRMIYFPSHSYEQYYQAVRRCWRFGQERPVTVDIVTTEAGSNIMENLKRKSDKASEMFASLVAHMNDAITIDSARTFSNTEEIPAWL